MKETVVVTLVPMKGTAVNPKSQEEYDILMKVYEAGGWKWFDGGLATSYNVFRRYSKKTCVCAGFHTVKEIGGVFGFGNVSCYKDMGADVITLQDFLDVQKIGPEKLAEILNK